MWNCSREQRKKLLVVLQVFNSALWRLINGGSSWRFVGNWSNVALVLVICSSCPSSGSMLQQHFRCLRCPTCQPSRAGSERLCWARFKSCSRNCRWASLPPLLGRIKHRIQLARSMSITRTSGWSGFQLTRLTHSLTAWTSGQLKLALHLPFAPILPVAGLYLQFECPIYQLGSTWLN